MREWNNNMSAAPHNRLLLVQNKAMRDVLASFDPTWGGGRGAWFDRKNQVVTGAWCWRDDVDDYLAKRSVGPHIIPVL